MQQKNKVKNFTWWLPSRPEQIGKNVSAFQCSSQAKIKSAAGFPKQNTSHSSLPACLLFLCSVDKMVSAVDNDTLHKEEGILKRNGEYLQILYVYHKLPGSKIKLG